MHKYANSTDVISESMHKYANSTDVISGSMHKYANSTDVINVSWFSTSKRDVSIIDRRDAKFGRSMVGEARCLGGGDLGVGVKITSIDTAIWGSRSVEVGGRVELGFGSDRQAGSGVAED